MKKRKVSIVIATYKLVGGGGGGGGSLRCLNSLNLQVISIFHVMTLLVLYR